MCIHTVVQNAGGTLNVKESSSKSLACFCQYVSQAIFIYGLNSKFFIILIHSKIFNSKF